MKTSQKKIVLENILLENKDCFARITEFRDLVLEQLDEPDCDKAALRRWIYSRIKTMGANGLIESRQIPNTNRWEYRYIGSDLAGDRPLKQENTGDDELEKSLDIIESQLLELKISSRVFHRQLAAYKKVQQDHPALAQYAKTKYQQIFEERYELGALIKTYEETLVDHGRSAS